MAIVTDGLWWDDEDANHIRSRSDRYPGSADIEPEWTLEAAGDPHRVVRDPDPRSRAAYIRIIGYSPGAGFVLTVIVDRRLVRGHGVEDARSRSARIPRG